MSGVILAASVDQYAAVKMWTVADGLPKTDATFETSGLSIKYQINNGAVQSITVGESPAPASMSAGGAHADWGIYHLGNGWYKIGLADAVLATAGNRVTVWIELTDCDSAPAEIYVSGYDGAAVAVGANTTTPPTAAANATQTRTELATELGRIDANISSRSTLTAANVWDHATRSLTTFGTLISDIWSHGTRTLTAISDSAGITTLLSRIVGTLSAGTHEPQTGDSFARLGAPEGASIAEDIAGIASEIELPIPVSFGTTPQIILSDTAPRRLLWSESDETITGTIQWEGQSAKAITGAITFAETINGVHFYNWAYDEADRPASPSWGIIILTDGDYTDEPLFVQFVDDPTDAKKVSGSHTAAARLRLSAESMVLGEVTATPAPSTTEFGVVISPVGDPGQYIRRSLIFTSGDLIHTATLIRGYAVDMSGAVLTVAELPQVPANGDTFIIV